MILKKLLCKHTCTKKLPPHDDCGKQNFHARAGRKEYYMRKNIMQTYVPRKMRGLFFFLKKSYFSSLKSQTLLSQISFGLHLYKSTFIKYVHPANTIRSTIICGVFTNNTPYSRAFLASSILNSDIQDVFSSPPRINSSVAVDKVKLFLCIAVLS